MSLCCQKCFTDEWLKEYVKENGEKEKCSFCKEESDYCIEAHKLYDLFSPVIALYTEVTNFMPLEYLKEYQGDYLWERIQNDWSVFEHADDVNEQILRDIFSWEEYPGSINFDDYFMKESDWYGIPEDLDMGSIWGRFCKEIKNGNRFFADKETSINKILDSLEYREKIYAPGEKMYRAKISGKYRFAPSKMGKPPLEYAKAGRGNPAGISYLYLASSKDTVIAEVKPYIGEHVTIGEFVVSKRISLVDLTSYYISSPFEYGEKLADVVDSSDLFKILSQELSKPLRPRDDDFDYLPTQYLCEAIKNKGYDGLMFKSSVSGGNNLILFEEDKTNCISTELHKIKSISYEGEVIQDIPEICWADKFDKVAQIYREVIEIFQSLTFWATSFEGAPSEDKDALILLLKQNLHEIEESGYRENAWTKHFYTTNNLTSKTIFIKNKINALPFNKYEGQLDPTDKEYAKKKKNILKRMDEAEKMLIELRDLTKENLG